MAVIASNKDMYNANQTIDKNSSQSFDTRSFRIKRRNSSRTIIKVSTYILSCSGKSLADLTE